MLILVSGLPGSGKSYFASRLSRRLGAVYINSDQTRKAIDRMGRYAFEDKLDVYEEMAKSAGENLRQGKNVVVDATFYRPEMQDIFFTLSTLLHKQIFYIEVKADEKIIQERLSKPRADSEAGFAVYRQLKLEYQSPGVSHLVLHSTNDNIDFMLNQGLAYIQPIP